MKLLSFLYFQILKLRYKFNISWLEKIDKNKQYLVFPNHQALVDPQIIVSLIWQKINLSPVISQTYYNIPVLKQFFKLMWAVSMWDIQRWTSSIEDINKSLEWIKNWIKNRKNILLYPAWQLYSQWYEVIKWKKSAFNIVKEIDDKIEILVVRTTGLWWSHWSKAWNWETPNFIKTFLKSILILIWNILFLTPKREVNIEIENYTKKLKNIKNINEFNQILEDFYNKDWEEIIKYNRHFFYFDNVKNKKEPSLISWSIKSISNSNKIDENIVPKEVKEKIIKRVCEIKEIQKEKINLESNLINDLFFDSLDLAEIKAFIQTNFQNSDNPPITSLKTIWDLCIMAIWKSNNNEKLKDCEWWKNKKIYSLIDNLN